MQSHQTFLLCLVFEQPLPEQSRLLAKQISLRELLTPDTLRFLSKHQPK